MNRTTRPAGRGFARRTRAEKRSEAYARQMRYVLNVDPNGLDPEFMLGSR